MKKDIAKRLSMVIAVTMLLVLFLNLFLQIESTQKNMQQSAYQTIDRIKEILARNDEDLLHLTQSLKEGYLVRAETLAYMLVNHPEKDRSSEELLELAKLLQVDEINLYDKNGTLYSGSHPEFYGYSMYDGEQISYFLPMLEDTSLSLCQDVMPNTILGKDMIYAAVWRSDKSGIVQIGIDPERILEAIEKNEISYIFSHLAVEDGVTCVAVSVDDKKILGSTETELTGRSVRDVGLNLIPNYTQSYLSRLDNALCRCVFMEYEGMMIGVMYQTDVLYQDLTESMLLVFLYLVFAAVIMIVAILKSLDNLVINNINVINNKLEEISYGNLDTRIDGMVLPEFVDLSSHINQMTDSLLNSSVKISRILDMIDYQIGFFEYSEDSRQVLVTHKVAAILAIAPDEMKILAEDREKFAERIDSICSVPVERYKNVYSLPTETECYVKLETYVDNKSTFGIVMDVTEETIEKLRLRHERDHDTLTQLNSRRAFYRRLNELFAVPGDLGMAAMLMFDLDGLKTINDTLGHAGGDKAIREAADILSGIGWDKKSVARLSGDEFAVFLYGADNFKELQQHIDELYRNMLKAEVTVFGSSIPVRLSGGYVFYPEHRVSYTELLRMADRALYQSKGNGKAKFTAYCEEFEHT